MKPLFTHKKPVDPSLRCVCCEEAPHANIPDRDLQGYVCKECDVFLRVAEVVLAKNGLHPCAGSE